MLPHLLIQALNSTHHKAKHRVAYHVDHLRKVVGDWSLKVCGIVISYWSIPVLQSTRPTVILYIDLYIHL